MPYNAQAETYAIGRTPSQAPGPYTTPPSWRRFNDVYSDIADVTPLDRPFHKRDLIGHLQHIQALSPKTQYEIVAVVLRDMQTLPPEADGIRRIKAGAYQWRLSPT